MATDARFRCGFTAMLQSVEAPAAPLEQIRERMRVPGVVQEDRRPFAIAVAAAVVLIVGLALPIASPGVVQTLQEKIAAILHWTPPAERPAASVYQRMKPQTVSLREAQARVRFAIVAPAGLPADAGSPTIAVAPTGVYSRATRTWRVGPAIAMFWYKRNDGRTFGLSAAPASTQTSPPSKYTFEDRGVDKAGNPILVKHQRFVWRNGDQIMTAIADDGLTAAEIATIRTAMHGVPIPGVWPPKHGADETMMRVMPPR
ncbi:MAG: hypothetical protein WBD74_01285 [Candidatus Aquilonibacter sp.]